MDTQILKIKRVGNRGEALPLPKYATEGSSGLDLLADEETELEVGQSKVIPTGLSVEIPTGFELQIRSRSGLAAKSQVVVLNSPGTIDSDFRGELCVILYREHGNIRAWDMRPPFKIKRGDRIAQAVLCPVVQANLVEVENLDETERGSGGFGSTGV